MKLVILILSALAYCNRVHSTENFDFFVLAQQWPQSICTAANFTHEHHCAVDQNVTTWSLHGLWPTETHTSPPGPNYCNSSAKFDITALNPVWPLLMKYWSNLYKETKVDDLWKHEWTKHGTCASQLPALGSEYKYFSSALKLNRKFDLVKIFGEQGVVPKDNYVYPYTDVLKVAQQLGNASLQCYYDKYTKTQYLSQVEICLSTKLELVNCKDYPAFLSNQAKSRNERFMKNTQGVNDREGAEPFDFHGLETCYDTEPIAYPVIKH